MQLELLEILQILANIQVKRIDVRTKIVFIMKDLYFLQKIDKINKNKIGFQTK